LRAILSYPTASLAHMLGNLPLQKNTFKCKGTVKKEVRFFKVENLKASILVVKISSRKSTRREI